MTGKETRGTATIEHGLSYADYDKRPGLRSSELKHGAKSMLHMHAYATSETGDETKIMRIGRLMHAAVLEPAVFAKHVSIWGGKKRYGKDWDSFCDEHDEEWAVTPSEHADLLMASAQVWGHREAAALVRATKHEVSLFWEDSSYGPAKIRLDGFCPKRGIIEYKTTGSVDSRSFGRTCANMIYDIQMGWGWHATQLLTGRKDMPYHIIAQEQKRPYDVVVYGVPESVLVAGYERAAEIAAAYRCSEALGVFGGTCGEVVPLEWPVWAGGEGGDVVDMEGLTDE